MSVSKFTENSTHEIALDDVDFRIVSLMTSGRNNKEISNSLKIPLSTIQRRVRNITTSGIVSVRILPDFKRLGIKKGLIHIYLRDGNIKESASEVAKMNGFLTASVHIGNSDIVGEFVYEDSEQLIDTISSIKHMGGVERVLWSEEVFSVPVTPEYILDSFKKMWKKSHYQNNNNHNNGFRGKNKIGRKISY